MYTKVELLHTGGNVESAWVASEYAKCGLQVSIVDVDKDAVWQVRVLSIGDTNENPTLYLPNEKVYEEIIPF